MALAEPTDLAVEPLKHGAWHTVGLRKSASACGTTIAEGSWELPGESRPEPREAGMAAFGGALPDCLAAGRGLPAGLWGLHSPASPHQQLPMPGLGHAGGRKARARG